ncbi:MAG: 6-phosphogluconolactonase [Candidatus Portnoybacteria bacterium]|nr:6-phosphogluconolactonase [Candidatus Portnoybacteria bacterium]
MERSPEGIYEKRLVLDKEFTYVPRSDPASYERFAREKLLESLEKKIDGAITGSILKPDLRDLKAFDTFIEDHKGIDLLILAIGVKGHYAQVMPGTPIEKGFHVTKLIPELSAVHSQKGSKSYEGAKFREYGMSLGPKQVLGAKNIIVMITGESKIDLVKQLLSYKSFDPHFPLSIIHHPTVKPKIEVFLSKEVM